MAAGARSDVARNERGKRPAHITTATSALACCHAQAFSGPESTQSFSKMYLDSQVPTQRGSISSQGAASQYQQAALNLLNWVEVACQMAKDRHNRTAPSCRVLINFGNFSKSRGRAFCTVFLSVKSVFSTVAIEKQEMAEREGFEPPIALRLCLISSQVHSTGLCHLSADSLGHCQSTGRRKAVATPAPVSDVVSASPN